MPRPLPTDTWNNLFYPPHDYNYFIGAGQLDFEPEAAGFSQPNACWLADASLLAYVKDWDAVTGALRRAQFEDIHVIGTNPDLSTKGFIALRLNPTPFLTVAFRGTDRDDQRTVDTDVDIGPSERDGYTVHRGFAKALDQVWATEVEVALERFLETYPQGQVCFTGHSLGAALATIAVTRFSGPNCALYNIGSPRVGDDRFTRKVSSRTNRIFRFVNSQDIVTLIPPAIFQHVGQEKYIDRNGEIHDNPLPLTRDFDAAQGALHHDSVAAVAAIADPVDYLKSAFTSKALVDPPPYIVGNHTPARYAIRLWNKYTGL